MKIHVPDLFDPAAGSIDRHLHRAHDLLAVRVHLHAMIGVARRAVAIDGRIDPGAARPRANGRDASAGRWLWAVETARILENPKIMPGVTQASAPPDRITSASPARMSAAAYEI